MSQMPQQAALSKCPSCAWPLESGDRFCGACGYDLSAVPVRPDDNPTIVMNGSAPAGSGGHELPPGAPPPPPSPPPAGPVSPAASGPDVPSPPGHHTQPGHHSPPG
ncbi:zinc ribbon domain-containing protein, partial [Streptomyces regalis]|uniref:zinc ribbon domain-containing protein n=1 Tax=Streptomyces regalis TaxID=68262 RepID=UPI000B252193